MARRGIKKESAPESVASHHQPGHAFEGQQPHPASSGDTIVNDDVIMHEDFYQGHPTTQASKAERPLEGKSSLSWSLEALPLTITKGNLILLLLLQPIQNRQRPSFRLEGLKFLDVGSENWCKRYRTYVTWG